VVFDKQQNIIIESTAMNKMALNHCEVHVTNS